MRIWEATGTLLARYRHGLRSNLQKTTLTWTHTCAPERIRTPDQPGRNRMLYPLSYGGKRRVQYASPGES